MRLGFHLGPFSLSSGGRRRRRTRYWTHPGCTMHHRSQEAADKCANSPAVQQRRQIALYAAANKARQKAEHQKSKALAKAEKGAAKTTSGAESRSRRPTPLVAAGPAAKTTRLANSMQRPSKNRSAPMLSTPGGVCVLGSCTREREPGRIYCRKHGPKVAKR